MSTVKTTNLQHPSASDVGITLGADGSVVLPQGFTGGIGSNVVQTVKTDTFTTTSTSVTPVTGLAVSITPTSTSSKILVIVQINVSVGGSTGDAETQILLKRGGDYVYRGDAASNRSQTTGSLNWFSSTLNMSIAQLPFTFVYLDSPATTSSTTYGVDIRATNAGNTAYVNRSGTDTDLFTRSRTASSITAIEVAA